MLLWQETGWRQVAPIVQSLLSLTYQISLKALSEGPYCAFVTRNQGFGGSFRFLFYHFRFKLSEFQTIFSSGRKIVK